MAELRDIYFFMFFVGYGFFVTQGSGESIPKMMNDIYCGDKQPSSTYNVAKYGEGKHLNNGRNSSRRLYGRHVCTQNSVSRLPVKYVETYCKPAYQSYLRRCDKDSTRYCTGYRVVYKLAYRTVQRFIHVRKSVPACCPGWTQSQVSTPDCKKAICREECKNGGLCIKPDYCSCRPGWVGKTCEIDVNECAKKNNPCQHDCVNMPGSYQCLCKEGFVLQSDGRSCQKTDIQTNEVRNHELVKEMEVLQKKLEALEDWQRRLEAENVHESRHTRELRINSLSEQIAIIEGRLEEHERQVAIEERNKKATATYDD